MRASLKLRSRLTFGAFLGASLASFAMPGTLPQKEFLQASASSKTETNQPPPQSAQPASDGQASAVAAQVSPTVLKVTTKMVVVNAVVADSNGKPVAGLKAQDFELFENGKRQEIRGFGAKVPPSPGVAPEPHRKLAPGVFTNTVDVRPDEGAPIILLLDTLNTPWADQAYGRSQLQEYLKKNALRRNVAIYVLGHRLALLQDFTNDPEVLHEVVSGISVQPFPSDHGDGESLSINPAAVSPGSTNDPRQLLAQVMKELAQDHDMITVSDRDRAIATTLEAFRTIANHAAAVPGRKELIWLSAGFPLNFNVASQTAFVSVLQDTTNLLTDAEVAVYPVDISGLVAFDPASMESGMAHLVGTHAGMYQMASRTGGQALYDRNDVDQAIGIAVEDGLTYYELGYYPTNKDWNNEFRSIQVKVRQRGMQVRARKGYFATSVASGETPSSQTQFLRAVAQDTGSAGMLPFFAHVLPPDKEHAQVLLDIRVDPRSVLFTLQPNGDRQAEVNFIALVLDEKNKPVTSKSSTLKVNLKPEGFAEVMRTSLPIRQQLDLAPGHYRLRLGVCDLKSSLIGTLTAHVDVASKN